MSAWDPTPLARAILADPEAPPVLVLAAWLAVYRDRPEWLIELAYEAAA